MKGNPVLYKTLVVGVIVLIFGMSVVSSTIGIAEDKSSNNYFLESANNPKDLLSCDHFAYVRGDAPDYCLYEFILNDPGNLTCVCEGGSEYTYISHVTWSYDNYIYFTQYGPDFFYIIDIDSCGIYTVGGAGLSLTGGLAYDLTTPHRMFGVGPYGSDDYLIEVDPDTGEQNLLGPLGGGIYCTSGIALDSEGNLYGWDAGNNKLWIIDIETCEATIVGSLGFNINSTYICDGDFCKEDDTLYIAHENKLYMYDLDEGQCELIDEFPDYVSVTGLAIPYPDTTPPFTTHNLDPSEPDGCNDWYVSNVNVTLNATDDVSGVWNTYYRINGGWWISYKEPFTLSEDGDDILIEYYSIDIAGNVEQRKSFTVDIDQTPPDTGFSYEIVGGNWWQGWEYEFSFTATDVMSGLNATYYRIDGGEWEIYTGPFITLPGDGDDILIEYYSVSNAGNVEDVKSVRIPRTRASSFLWYEWLIGRYPLLEVIISKILGL